MEPNTFVLTLNIKEQREGWQMYLLLREKAFGGEFHRLGWRRQVAGGGLTREQKDYIAIT